MKQLAVVQFFTWFALPCMWQFFGLAVARHVFLARRMKSRHLFARGTEWGGLCFAVYNVVCFVIAFLLPGLAKQHEPQDGAHDCACLRRHRFDLGLLHYEQVDAVCQYGRCWHCLGVDPVDALRDAFDSGAAGAHGRLHGRVQSFHRDSADRDVVDRAEDLTTRAGRRSAQCGRVGWVQSC